VADPLIAASDRASVCLFLRGDASVAAKENEKWKLENEQWKDVAALRLDKERGSMALVTPRTCGGFAESGRVEAGPLSFTIAGAGVRGAASPPVVVPTTLWASSLDGAPLATSSRILLVHLTDVQGEGAKFADAPRRILLVWGKAPLVAAGAADVTMQLSTDGGAWATSPTVWALDTAGRRVAEVPAAFSDGALRFRVSTRGPEGGRLYYEIVR
ncbi:MAG: hypothetical protein IKO55_05980, partial [Kiritimatiellae bacterium]|nr:hypothetical protein [Kiritimatiellia bacterium]